MKGDDHYGVRSREQKKKRADKVLNISIGIVVLLILLVAGQFFLGGKSSEPTVSDKKEDIKEAVEEDDSSDNLASEAVKVDEEGQLQGEHGDAPDNKETNQQADQGTVKEPQSDDQAQQMGKWQPIGTVQEEPFTAVYEKEHVNWEEMTKALQYATGLGDGMTIWFIENGGDHKSAVGTVSDYSTRTTPYKVRLEWVTNEGWMPVSLEQLDENPYLEKYTSSEEEETSE